jgi:hypothetical protein
VRAGISKPCGDQTGGLKSGVKYQSKRKCPHECKCS